MVHGRHRLRRSKSREMDCVRTASRRSHDDYDDDVGERTHGHKNTNDNRKGIKLLDKKIPEESSKFKDRYHCESRSDKTSSDGNSSDGDRDQDRNRHQSRSRKSQKRRRGVSEKLNDYKDIKNRTYEAESDWNFSDGESDAKTHHVHTERNWRYTSRREVQDDDGDSENRTHKDHGERDCSHTAKRSRVSDRRRMSDPDSGHDLLDRDKEGRHSHEKHSRKGNREHKHSRRRSHSRKESSKSKHRHSKSNEDHESSSLDEYEERHKTIDKHDRWKLASPEEDKKHQRKSTSVQSYESDRAGCYDG